MRIARKRATVLAALAATVAALALGPSPRGEADSNANHGEVLPASCRPTNWGEGEALIRRNPASRHVLVPAGPQAMLLCRYWGYGVEQTEASQARAGELAGERRLLRRSLVRSLARQLNRTQPAPGAYACPFDEGANLYAVFAYADQPSVVVEIHLSGCGFASNGYGHGGWPPPRLVKRLERLVPARD